MADPELVLDVSDGRGLKNLNLFEDQAYRIVNISNNIVRSFAFLERFPNLETLVARSCKIADINQLLCYCPRGLKNLDLSNNLITDFKNIDHPYLETLILDGNPLRLFTELQLTP